MTSQVVIITPGLTSGTGGVADHTRSLLGEWPPIPNLTIFVPEKISASADWPQNVKRLGANTDEILAQLPAQSSKVFVQYSAYGFNRIGYPRDLLAALIAWKKRGGGQLVMMFHEIWAFWPILNRNFLIQQLHRRHIKRLLQVCDAVFTTTNSQEKYLRALGCASVQVVPVGSNIPRRTSSGGVAKSGSAALFGLEANRIRALQTMRKSLAALSASGRLTRIVCVGAGSGDSEVERDLLVSLNLSEGFSQPGAMSPDAVSDVLTSAAFGIFGQSELSYSKSGSFMAYAAHELAVLANFADRSKLPPACWLIAPAELLSGISEGELKRRAECLRMWQEQNCSWDVIARKIGRPLAIGMA